MSLLYEIIDGDLAGERHWCDGFGTHVQISHGPWAYTFRVLSGAGHLLSQVERRSRESS